MSTYEKSDIVYRWRLEQYRSEMGRLALDDWRKGQTVAARAFMDTFLKNLAKKEAWTYPDIDGLKGRKYQGLSELRWKFGGVPQRLIGYTSSDHTFVILIGCTHNAKKYTPPDALDTAVTRKGNIAAKKATTSEYQLTTDN